MFEAKTLKFGICHVLDAGNWFAVIVQKPSCLRKIVISLAFNRIADVLRDRLTLDELGPVNN
jgi:hypothetical protein